MRNLEAIRKLDSLEKRLADIQKEIKELKRELAPKKVKKFKLK